MPDGWIYESPCGCVLHQEHVEGATFRVLEIAIASRLCATAHYRLRSAGADTTPQLRQHMMDMLDHRESEFSNESHTC